MGINDATTLQNSRYIGINPSEAVALRALGFVRGDRSVREQFSARSTMQLSELNHQPIGADCLVAVLDFLIGNETALLKFADTIELPPVEIYEARRMVAHGIAGYRSRLRSSRADKQIES
jgi:hypothetical protein